MVFFPSQFSRLATMLSAVYIVRVTCSIFQALGLLLTAWRIYIRFKTHRFWWEDAWAALLLLTGLSWLIVQWVFLCTNGLTSIINSWIYSIGFTSIITTVRMSVLFSIIRIIHTSPRLLKFAYACVGFFAAAWMILVVQKAIQCSNTSWHHQEINSGSGKPFCRINARTSIFQFTIDCVAVLILVILPLCMLWRVKLPCRKRRMILSIFASSLFLAFGALLHTIGQVLNIYLLMIAGINVEIALAFIVCNLLVVVTHMYRLLSPTSTEDTSESTSSNDDFTTRLPTSIQTTTQSLTSIDLDISLPSSDCQSA